MRIELPKGSYCPDFVAVPAISPPPELPVTAAPETKTGWNLRSLLTGFLAGALLVALPLWFALRPQPAPVTQPRLAPIVREFWGPLLAPDANVRQAHRFRFCQSAWCRFLRCADAT